MKRKIFIAAVTMTASLYAAAQQVRPEPSNIIYGEIARIRNLTNVLYVAAHPDDENTRLLAYLVNKKHINTSYLSLTRGDGGQNLLGSEQGEALGLIRTNELIAARKLDGAGQYFSRAIDFGFSKSYEETFRHWDANILCGDAVRAIRRFRPDVIICRFPPDSMAGHGQHAASAIVAEMAYKAAGDAGKYTGQLKYWKPWHAKRLMFNSYRFGSRNTTSEDQLKVEVGQYLPGMGMGVGELAGRSRSVHKSQGAGTPSTPGVQREYFKLVAGDPCDESLFDGIDISWGRVGRMDIDDDLTAILHNFDQRHPDRSIDALLAVRRKVQEVKDEFWRTQKTAELDKAILDCAGFMAEMCTSQAEAVPGEELAFTLKVIARSRVPVRVRAIDWIEGGDDSTANLKLSDDSLYAIQHRLRIPANTPVTEPYWLSQPRQAAALYYMPDGPVGGLPEAPAVLNTVLHLYVGGSRLDVKVPVSYKRLDPVKGDVVEQLHIVPPLTIAFSNELLVAGANGTTEADVRLHAYGNIADETLQLRAGKSGKVVYEVKGIHLKRGTDTVMNLRIKTTGLGADITLVPGFASHEALTLHIIRYSHLPTLQYVTHASARVLRPDWKCTAHRIGYITGAGDHVPEILRMAGLKVDILTDADLTNAANLKKYDAIMTGIRAVNAEKRMTAWLPVLLQYARNGGTLVMQYNTTHNLPTYKLGPFPFTLSSKRVTEEDAAVQFTDAGTRLLNYPNKISERDFDGWVQERGLYFASDWDSHYKTLFSMHDEGEAALKGSTLYTKTGKGNYIYTSLSFSRQLPAGNAGAIRLLMNMLSAGK